MFETLLGAGKKQGAADNSDLPYPAGTVYKGIARAQNFITGDQLASAIGLTSGTSVNSDAGWFHFDETDTGGRDLYIAKKCIRISATYTQIQAAIKGGYKEVTINNQVYVVQLMKATDKSAGTHVDSDAGGDWNKYLYPIYGGNERSSLPANTPVWGSYTEAMMGMPVTHQTTVNESQTICREPDPSGGRAVRGYSSNANTPNIMGLWYMASDDTVHPALGFRPMLVRKDTLPVTPFKGEVAQADFITFNDLYTALGMTTANAGSPIPEHVNEPWLKFVTASGNTRYFPKKSIRYNLTREQLNTLGLVTGKLISFGGNTYRVRLFLGRVADPSQTVGKEWSELIGPISDGTWAAYSAADLRTGTGGNALGELAIVQENDGRGWATNGYPGILNGFYMNANQTNTGYGWRPIVELVTPVAGGDEAFMIDPSNQTAGDTAIKDRSVNNIAITNSGVVVSDVGPGNGIKSLYFNNTALNYLRWAAANMPNLLTGDFTIEYYERAESRPGAAAILAQWAQIAGAGGLIAGMNADGTDYFSFAPYSEAGATPLTTSTNQLLQWRHLAITRKGSVFTVWVNGNSVGTFSSTGTYAKNATDWTMGVYMGRTAGVVGQDNAVKFNGWLAKVRVYSRCKYTANFTPD